MFERSCLVVAHPDDDVLWFSSILRRVDRVIMCFLGNPERPKRGDARKRVLARYPFPVECLGIDVSNIDEARSRLRVELADCENVFTHNPWGEYGNVAHIEVHRISVDFGHNPWFSNYVSDDTLRHSFARVIEPVRFETDIETAHAVRDIYIEEGCWTAPAKHVWCREEYFTRRARSEYRPGVCFPLNYVPWGTK